jgi:peptidoglycan/xylan/chitin deacetylase (PgdA/CDA1 family)
MNIVFTIDVECYSGDYEREVFSRGLGLPFILACLKAHGASATFFVEALGATRWGISESQRICHAIAEAGQEIQLHLHPSVAKLDGFVDKDDVFWNQEAVTQERLLRVGMDVLAQCGVRATAFRAGDFAANLDTLKAMKHAGILVSSNRDLDTKSSIRSKINHDFPVVNDVSCCEGVVDVPVTAFRSPLPGLDGQFRHFEISALSFREMKDGLMKAYRAGYSTVGILTHPGEFFRHTRCGVVPIEKNRRRLEQLLAFIKSRPEFKVCTISECATITPMPKSSPPEIRLALPYTLLRVVEQGVDRIRARLGR